MPDEQPGKRDLSRKNSRKGGFLDKQATSLVTGPCDKLPVKKKTKLKKSKKLYRGSPTEESFKRRRISPTSTSSSSSIKGNSFSSS